MGFSGWRIRWQWLSQRFARWRIHSLCEPVLKSWLKTKPFDWLGCGFGNKPSGVQLSGAVKVMVERRGLLAGVSLGLRVFPFLIQALLYSSSKLIWANSSRCVSAWMKPSVTSESAVIVVTLTHTLQGLLRCRTWIEWTLWPNMWFELTSSHSSRGMKNPLDFSLRKL